MEVIIILLVMLFIWGKEKWQRANARNYVNAQNALRNANVAVGLSAKMLKPYAPDGEWDGKSWGYFDPSSGNWFDVHPSGNANVSLMRHDELHQVWPHRYVK